MNFHKILKKIFVPPFVKVENDIITFKPWVFFKKTMTFESIQTIKIETNDKGPLFEDFFIVLTSNNKIIRIGQETEGFNQLMKKLQEFPEFNNEAVVQASSCVENTIFNVWQKGCHNQSLQPTMCRSG